MSVLFTLNNVPQARIVSVERGKMAYGSSPRWKQNFYDRTAERLKVGQVLLDADIVQILRQTESTLVNPEEQAPRILRTTMAASVLLSRAVELTVMSCEDRAITYHDSLVDPSKLAIQAAATHFYQTDELTKANSPEWKQREIDNWLAEAVEEYELAKQLRP